MKRNKNDSKPVRQITKPVLLLLVSLAVISLASLLLISYIWNNLKLSGYFTVDEVVVKDSALNLSYLKGHNIFDIDLRGESRRILEAAPNCCNVRLVRVLPNRIYVEFIERTPVAFVRLHQYFAVDDDAVLFNSRSSYQEAGLPLIVGLESKISAPKAGRRYPTAELGLAINIIKFLLTESFLKAGFESWTIVFAKRLSPARILLPLPKTRTGSRAFFDAASKDCRLFMLLGWQKKRAGPPIFKVVCFFNGSLSRHSLFKYLRQFIA